MPLKVHRIKYKNVQIAKSVERPLIYQHIYSCPVMRFYAQRKRSNAKSSAAQLEEILDLMIGSSNRQNKRN